MLFHIPGFGVEVVGKADPDAAAAEGRDEQTQWLFFLAGGSSPP